jgi:TolB-like protein
MARTVPHRWLVALALTTACATSQVDVDPRADLPADPPVALLPVVNASGAPLAGERAEAILTTLLRRRGLTELRVHDARGAPDGVPELDDRRAYARALARAREAGIPFGVTGTVVEWQYRPGLADEAAVSISLRVVDVPSGQVVWSASGARGGGGTVAASAQGLLRELTDAMPLGRR